MVNLTNLFNLHDADDNDADYHDAGDAKGLADFAVLKFCKMHGNGNDFVIFCCDEGASGRDYFDAMCERVKANAVNIADRNFGIGCDQIVVLMRCEPSENGDLNCTIRLYNADGTTAAMCGNALRCITGLVCGEYGNGADSDNDNGSGAKLNVRIETESLPARVVACMNESDGVATVDMGRFAVKTDADGELFVNVGNNHKIVMKEDLRNGNTLKDGTIKGGTLDGGGGFIPVADFTLPDDEYNVNYMNIIDDEKIAIATVERGAGLTLSCGSGACASAIYHQFKLNGGLSEAQEATTYVYDAGQKITINDKALRIKTRFIDADESLEVACGFVYMTGKYKYVFAGEIALN